MKNSQFVGQSVPTRMVVGRTYSALVQMRNTAAFGSWSTAIQIGSQNPQDNLVWGVNRANVSATTGANQVGNFPLTIVAPSTPGAYNFQWRTLSGTTWFGATTPNVVINVYSDATQSVSLTEPANGATYTVGSTVWLTADADFFNGVERVEFWIDGVLVAQDAYPIYQATWTATLGSHTIVAKAFAGSTMTSTAAVTFNVLPPPNTPPTVALTAPVNGATQPTLSAMAFSASANDSDGIVQRVEFWVDGALFAQDTTAPYSAVWTVVMGTHSVVAKAYDDGGASVASDAVIVTGTNNLPSVALTSPASGASVSAGSAVPMTATASDVDGSIQRVEFLVDGVEVGEDNSAPYSVTWAAKVGSHAITARAIDNMGGMTTTGASLITVTPPSPPPANVSLVRRYVYDAHQRVCKVIEPESGATLFHYDSSGNVDWSATGLPLTAATNCASDEAVAQASGRVVHRTYDALNRLKTMQFPDGIGDQSWQYEKDGLPSRVEAQNPGVTVVNTYAYNRRRLAIGETVSQPDGSTWGLSYFPDRNGNLARVLQPDGEMIDNSPNALGQPTSVSSQYATYASNVSFFANGALRQFTYGNGIVHTMAQNMRGLPERSRDIGTTVILDDTYDYDTLGNVIAITDAARSGYGNRDMTYDDLDRLIEVDSPMFGAGGARYGYDSVDNLIFVRAPGRDQTYWYDGSNHLTNVRDSDGASVVGMDYDPQGNRTNKNGTHYEFDIGNRLMTVRYGSDEIEEYRYDGNRRRVFSWKSADNATILRSQYDQNGVLRYQFSNRRGQAIGYVYLGRSLIAKRLLPIGGGAATIEYLHTDALRSPVATTNAAGTLVSRKDYEPYGSPLDGVFTDAPGFTGHVMDEKTGLTYMQQRYYDPSIGAFLSIDPIAADKATGAGFNRYWYAGNSPYNNVDPDGRGQNPFQIPAGTPTVLPRTPQDAADIVHRQATPSSTLALTASVGGSLAGGVPYFSSGSVQGSVGVHIPLAANQPVTVYEQKAAMINIFGGSASTAGQSDSMQWAGGLSADLGWQVGLTNGQPGGTAMVTNVVTPAFTFSYESGTDGTWGINVGPGAFGVSVSQQLVDSNPIIVLPTVTINALEVEAMEVEDGTH